MDIHLTLNENGYVILPLEEYERLKRVEETAKKLYAENRKRILKEAGIEE